MRKLLRNCSKICILTPLEGLEMPTVFRSSNENSNIAGDRSAGDRKRHREKVRGALKENLGSIISEEAIIGQSGDKKIKVPIKGIKEYRFIYGSNNPGVAQGTGEEKPGDIVQKGTERGPGLGPGSDPGEDIYETEISLDELIELLFEDLHLPDLEKKKLHQIEQERLLKRKGYRLQGIRVQLSKKKTVTEKLRRKQSYRRALSQIVLDGGELLPVEEDEPRFPFHNEDLRYRHMTAKPHRHSNAVIFCIMDTSGSMDMTKKYLARSFYFLLYRFILTKYQNVEVVFISHHTEAKEVTEDEFFHKGESGGTNISSGYKKALEIIEIRYHPALWNIYAFHCSDGDNFEEDNEEALKQAERLVKVSNLFGYGEIKPEGSYSWSSMLDRFEKIKADNLVTVKIHVKEDVWPAFQRFLSKDRVKD